ncbi:MAG: SDR family NAD(P)-dependent oxidoreductase [Lewinella sp.]|nr:SDR family NAD(P)-dependent oxidoreductase [Lewinella sp.]
MPKTALVTGANRGIGQEIARQLLQRGWYVWLGVRNLEKGKNAVATFGQTSGQAHLLQLDVADTSSVQRAATAFRAQSPRLDVLINNAAILDTGRQDFLTVAPDDVARTLDVNVLGALRMIQAFRGLMPAGSRIINVSSSAGAFCSGVSSYEPVYSFSKASLNVLTCHLARDLSPAGIAVNAVCPGWVRTDMGGPGAPRSVEQGAETPVWLATEADPSFTGKFWRDKHEIKW